MTNPEEPDRRPEAQGAQQPQDAQDADATDAAAAAGGEGGGRPAAGAQAAGGTGTDAPAADAADTADAADAADAADTPEDGTGTGTDAHVPEDGAPGGAGADAPTDGGHREPAPKDRVYRSGPGLAGGVLLLALIVWLGADALIRGTGRTPWLALAMILLLAPLVVAFTLRPAVFANTERLRIRNPFRVITLPWGSVATLRSRYSNEAVVRSGRKYQLWALPVSVRDRKRVGRQQLRASGASGAGAAGGLFGGPRTVPGTFGAGRSTETRVARVPSADQAVADLRDLAEACADTAGAQGEPEVHWSYEVLVPALAGAILLVVLVAMG